MFQDYDIDYHKKINGDQLSEQERYTRRKPVVLADISDEINYQMEVMERSFLKLDIADIPSQYKPDTLPVTSTKHVNNLLKNAKKKLAGDNRQAMSNYSLFEKHSSMYHSDYIMTIDELINLDMREESFPHRYEVRSKRYDQSYMVLLYGIFKESVSKKIGSKDGNWEGMLHMIKITDGINVIEMTSLFDRFKELLTDIKLGDRVLIHCIKGNFLRGDTRSVKYDIESIIKVKELE